MDKRVSSLGGPAPVKQLFHENLCSITFSYQAFYGLNHYNLLETGSFLIRKLNQPTSCLMLQFKDKNTRKLPLDSSLK